MKQEYLLSKANKYDRSEANIKVINRIPTPSDMIANQVLKPTAFDKFTTYFMPVFCGVMWGLILYAILFS